MEAASFVTAVLVVLTLAVLGWLLMRVLRGQAGDSQALQGAWAERDRLVSDLQAIRESERTQAVELAALAARLSERTVERDQLLLSLQDARAKQDGEARLASETGANLRARESEVVGLRQRLAAAEHDAGTLKDALATLQAQHAEVVANLAHAEQAKQEIKGFLDTAQSRLSATFAELAGKTFEERGAQFEKNVRTATQQSKSDIETLLKPFTSQLSEFRTRVDTLYGEEAKERATLAGAVNELKTLNQDMAVQASALTRALKGNAKVRGDWGELMLESVLRSSGLEEGAHYDRQGSSKDDEGNRLRPDVVVRLPGDRRIVVDSKVNLVDWQQAMNADTPEEQQDALRRHAIALRQHVKDLGEKNYPKAVGESALEVTVAFVPIEGALSAALGSDPTLQTDAFARGVVFASPNTLMAVLRVVERLWTRDKIQRQAIEIGDAGGRVLDALQSFLSEFDQVGRKLADANTAFGAARGRLSESTHAVIPRARRLAELGVKGRKSLSAELMPDSPELVALVQDSPTTDG